MSEIVDYTLKKLEKLGGDDAIVALNDIEHLQVKFSNSKISIVQRWISKSLNVFASFNRRTVFTTLPPYKPSIDRGIKSLARFSSKISENKDYFGIAKGPFTYKNVRSFDESSLNVDMPDKTSAGINAAIENGAKRVSGVLDTTTNKTIIESTGNVKAEDKSTRCYFSIRSLCDNEGSGHSVATSRKISELRHIDAAVESANIARASMNPKQLQEGSYDVLFEHLPSAIIFEAVANSASMFNVEAGLSFFINKLGKKVASKCVSMADDATLDWSINSRRFDDEGVPCKKTAIIENGILKNFLHNSSTARKHKTETTANAGLIGPKPLNPVVEKGNLNKEDMLYNMKRGLLITNTWYTRFNNHMSGDFSTMPRDGIFLIEHGKITKPVKGIRVSENMIELLGKIAGLSNNSKPVMSWELEDPITVPKILVKNVNITKSSE